MRRETLLIHDSRFTVSKGMTRRVGTVEKKIRDRSSAVKSAR